MPWKVVTTIEQKQSFLEDYQLNDYSIAKLTERFCISWKTTYKWINRFKEHSQIGRYELCTNKIQGIVSMGG